VRRLFALAIAVLWAGCGEATFSAHSRDNSVDDIQRAMVMAQQAPPSPRSMAYLVTTGPDKQLVGFDLTDGKIRWQEKVDLRSRVIAGRTLIVHRQGDHDLVGRDPQTGRVTLTVHLEPADKFVGVTLDDERVYYVVQSTGAQRTSSVIAVDRTGNAVWRMPVTGSIGAPAVRGGVVVVPFSYQNVSLIDAKTGKEVARVRATDEQITFVRALPEGIFYGGSSGIYLLDAKSASGSKKDSSYASLQLGSDQIRTFYYWDGYQLDQANYSAFDRNRLLWRGEPRGGGVAFHDDLAILHSYRYFFAFDAKAARLKWAFAYPRVDMVAADDVGPSVVFAAADGDVGAIDTATGAIKVRYKTGLRLAGASFDADGFTGGADARLESGDLLKTLEQIVWDPDARFTAVKVFAVAAIGELGSTDATQALLKIVLKDGGVLPQVQKRADEILVARKDAGAQPLYLDALKLHYDYLADRHPHGVDVLAHACAMLDAKDAAPELAAHLLDPATPQSALKELAAALAGLGGKEAVRALRELLLTYRADPMFLSEPAALTIAAEGLLKHGSADDKRAVLFVADEKRTIPPLARYLKTALAPKK
jgi:outer membrane protein assembly factor BamB